MEAGDVLQFVEKHIGVGKQKTLGYCLQLVTEALLQGKQEEGLFLLMSSIMMIEQYTLDENWKTAWKMLDLPVPQFDKGQIVDLGTWRRDTAYSSLAESSWVSAVANRIKDEGVILKRRGKGAAKGKPPEAEA